MNTKILSSIKKRKKIQILRYNRSHNDQKK